MVIEIVRVPPPALSGSGHTGRKPGLSSQPIELAPRSVVQEVYQFSSACQEEPKENEYPHLNPKPRYRSALIWTGFVRGECILTIIFIHLRIS